MRFVHPALFAFAVSASVNVNALRQYQPRSSFDECANVKSELIMSGQDLGELDHCLCVSGIPALLSSNDVLKKAVVRQGESSVVVAVTTMIESAADYKKCYYPDHSEPKCDDNPCDFECKDGFKSYPEHYPTSCVCEYPHTVCNGECGEFEHCGSQKPKKRDAKWRDATCPQGWSACKLWGAFGQAFECVDVAQDLWSCGGCGIPLISTDPIGVDCTAIPGVHDVSCINSRCVVARCKNGFQISADQTTCIATTRTSPNIPVFFNNGASPFKA